MGVKSRTRAEKRKETRKNMAFARLNNAPTSPRKMRIVADLIRGKRVELALHILKTNPKHPAIRLHKLLLSAIANWQIKNEGLRIEESDLFVKEIQVDSGRILKRIRPAPQGRAHRIRKRSNHVTIIIDSLNKPEIEPDEPADKGAAEVKAQKKEKAPEAAVKEQKESIEEPKTAPKEAAKPKAATKPKVTAKPQATAKPKAAGKPKATSKPKAAPKSRKGTNIKSSNKKD
ncbi:MAG: 50S ribosomal protein L22 [Bacteroidales bacterium]|nr:50S ribosomal protein L22 [Bacteroidales bacterium]